jgi:Fe2+ transport system protein FeoA
MSLLEAPTDTTLKIVQICSGIEAKRKLTSLGIHINDSLVKLNEAKWGPLLVQNLSNGNDKIAVGRGLASNIIVSF